MPSICSTASVRDDFNGWDIDTQAFEWLLLGRHAGRWDVELL